MIHYEENNCKIICDDIITTDKINNNTIDLIITSPPYNLDKDYGESAGGDYIAHKDYSAFTKRWLVKCYYLAKENGRLCVNIPLDVNKGGKYPFLAHFIKNALYCGWKYNTTIIWTKGNIHKSTAWGSWRSATAPNVTTRVEPIVVLYKNEWIQNKRGVNDITSEEFAHWTNGIWTFPPAQASRVGHPAPFPMELPTRCIKLFSFVGDTILDPFMGSGTTLLSATQLNRKAIGVEKEVEYCELAKKRLDKEKEDLFYVAS